jgi:hypothetical protein
MISGVSSSHYQVLESGRSTSIKQDLWGTGLRES